MSMHGVCKASCYVAVMVAASLTGCMTNPGNGQYIGKRTNPIQFSGFCQSPNESVAVWARTNTGGWQHLGTVKSANYPLEYQGSIWYSWAHRATVPNSCWRSASSFAYVELAATKSSGELFTFNQGFGNYFGQYSSIAEMYDAEGAGTRVIVYADL